MSQDSDSFSPEAGGGPRRQPLSEATATAAESAAKAAGFSAAPGHSHGSAPAASQRTRRIVTVALVPAGIATLIAMIMLWPGSIATPDENVGYQGGVRAFGTVIAVNEVACPAAIKNTAQPADWVQRCGSATVEITDGPGKGQNVTVDLVHGPAAAQLFVNDDLVLQYVPDTVSEGRPYAVLDHQRSTPMIWMLALAAAAIVAFGRWRGIRSLAGLAVSFAVLLLFVIPAILQGSSPLLIAVVGSSAIMFAALYLTHGVNVHTSVAVAGTLVSLVITGTLGVVFTSAMRLTGVASEDSSYLSATQGGLDLRGLLLAGIVIGALGVLDDVTVTQATTVAELSADRRASRLQLYRAASRVGRAHVASAVNTIVLAYAGASLPLFLVIAAATRPVAELITSEFIAQEVLRSAVGTMGLVASVPITTALAVLVADQRPLRANRTSPILDH